MHRNSKRQNREILTTAPEIASIPSTKWGIEGQTAALAQELPQGLAAVALNPDTIDTRMLRSCLGEGTGNCPPPAEWAKEAAPYPLVTVPDFPQRS